MPLPSLLRWFCKKSVFTGTGSPNAVPLGKAVVRTQGLPWPLTEGAMTGLPGQCRSSPSPRCASLLCPVLGTLPSTYSDGSLGMELPFHCKTGDYLLFDPEKLWKALEGKKGR